MRRKVSEESIRTELCEGLVPDSPQIEPTAVEQRELNKVAATGTSDRGELIERLKRGESLAWVPTRNVCCYFQHQYACINVAKLESLLHEYERTTPNRTPFTSAAASPLLPSPDISDLERTAKQDEERFQAGLEIERPRSALHSGDFTESGSVAGDGHLGPGDSPLYRPEHPRWLTNTPSTIYSPFQNDSHFASTDEVDSFGLRYRNPSISSSLSSSFVLKPPTSPLVQFESNDDLDLSSDINPIDITPSLPRNLRRHTMNTPHSAYSTPSVPSPANFSRPLPHLRRDNTYPYQAHQPRRSLTSSISQPGSTPHTPFLRSRQASFSENSPLHASMVGSYEESILRGRMSTTPSKPLDFVAQIGVLGLGKCKSSLRCPAHVTLPFPAVFYSYETTTHGRSGKLEDGPSPYVGQIDLENNLPHPEEPRDSKRKRGAGDVGRAQTRDTNMFDGQVTTQLNEREIRRAEKQKRRSTSPRAPPGGSYRIPEKGQLQIIIKNPNKTAVKLFLVPYDLAGMEPGTKTFIRQRSYSAGPIIAPPLSSTAQTPYANPLDRPILRYLVHLHICSPSRGRFYLYKSIRVVFANRVPDGKEKLRNEISLPEPRFSTYKPSRESGFGIGQASSAGVSLAADKAFRRRSSGFPLGQSHRAFDSMDGITQALEKGFGGSSAFDSGSSALPTQAIPFSFARRPVQPADDERSSNLQSPTSSKSSRPPTSPGSGIDMSWDSNSNFGGYDKLSKGDAGYGGNMFTGSPDGGKQVAEGLLAKKLRDFGVGVQNQHENLDGV